MGLIDGILGTSNQDARIKLLKRTHPLYDKYVQLWNTGLDAYDGTGGFLDGTYLWQFPREDTPDFDARRAHARYHNYTETLVDIYLRHLTTSIERNSTDTGLTEWWLDVDGRGQGMSNYVESALGPALAAGHTGTLVDKSEEAPTGPAVRDDAALPHLVTYAPTAILDWRVDRNGLAAIKLAEAMPVTGLEEQPSPQDHGFLLWDRDQWARFNHKGLLMGTDEHQLGVVPVEMVRPKPSRRHPFIGKALVTPSVVLALYNRASEEDVVLRDQAFSLFVVSLPVDASKEDVVDVKQMLAQGVGTTTVAVVKGDADFKTADMDVSAAIRSNEQFLVAELYRMAHLRYERESLDAESGEAIRLQRQDLEQTLENMAEGLRDYELAVARRYFDWTAPDGAAAFERANVEIQYPHEFSLRDIESELASFAAAASLGIGATATEHLRRRVVNVMLPDLDPTTLKVVHEELKALQAPGQSSGAEALRQRATERLEAVGVRLGQAA